MPWPYKLCVCWGLALPCPLQRDPAADLFRVCSSECWNSLLRLSGGKVEKVTGWD